MKAFLSSSKPANILCVRAAGRTEAGERSLQGPRDNYIRIGVGSGGGCTLCCTGNARQLASLRGDRIASTAPTDRKTSQLDGHIPDRSRSSQPIFSLWPGGHTHALLRTGSCLLFLHPHQASHAGSGPPHRRTAGGGLATPPTQPGHFTYREHSVHSHTQTHTTPPSAGPTWRGCMQTHCASAASLAASDVSTVTQGLQ